MAARDTSHADGPEHGRGGLPSPAALAFGALTGGARLVRDLPATAVRLPVRGLNLAFTVTEKVQREAAALQHRGEQLVQLVQALRGTGAAAAGDDLDEIFARARAEAGEPSGVVTDLAERAAERAERVADLVESTAGDAAGTPVTRRPRAGRPGAKPTTRRSASGPRQPAKRAGTRPDAAAEVPAPEAPAPEAVEAGAPGTATDLVARAEQEAAADLVVPGGGLSSDQLPLPGFDNLSIGALRSRLARLDRNQLVQLLDYERAHAARLQVVTMLENRIAKVERAGDAGAPAKAAAGRARAPRTAPAKKAAPGTPPAPPA